MSQSLNIITDNSFKKVFEDLTLGYDLDGVKAAVATLTLAHVQSIVGSEYLNGQGVSAEKFYNEFLPELLGKLDESLEAAFLYIQDCEHEADVEDYFDFLSEKADELFPETRLDLNTDFSKFYELFQAYDSIMNHASSFENFVIIPESDFEEYMKEYGLELGVVSASHQEYFDWEKFAQNSKSDYVNLTINAPNTLSVGENCLMRV